MWRRIDLQVSNVISIPALTQNALELQLEIASEHQYCNFSSIAYVLHFINSNNILFSPPIPCSILPSVTDQTHKEKKKEMTITISVQYIDGNVFIKYARISMYDSICLVFIDVCVCVSEFEAAKEIDRIIENSRFR